MRASVWSTLASHSREPAFHSREPASHSREPACRSRRPKRLVVETLRRDRERMRGRAANRRRFDRASRPLVENERFTDESRRRSHEKVRYFDRTLVLQQQSERLVQARERCSRESRRASPQSHRRFEQCERIPMRAGVSSVSAGVPSISVSVLRSSAAVSGRRCGGTSFTSHALLDENERLADEHHRPGDMRVGFRRQSQASRWRRRRRWMSAGVCLTRAAGASITPGVLNGARGAR